MNTVQIIYQRKRKRKVVGEKVLLFILQLFGALIIAWVPIFLLYEIPCKLGKYYGTDLLIVRAALRAEQKVTMKYRTGSYSINKIVHELEEMKEFYSRI